MIKPNPAKDYLRQYQELGVTVRFFSWGWLPVSLVGCPVDPVFHTKICAIQKEHLGFIQTTAKNMDIICFNGYPSTSLASVLPPDIPKYLIAREVVDETSPSLDAAVNLLQKHIRHAIAIGPVEASQLNEWNIAHTVVFNAGARPPKFRRFPEHPPVHFGVFGQLVPVKGQDRLVLACFQQAEALRQANARIHIYGGTGSTAYSPIEADIKGFVDEKGLQDLIIMEGWTNNVEEQLASLHCIVRPDLSGSPWGRDVIEAMCVGRPILATGSNPVFVQPGKTGWLIQPDQPTILGRTILSLAQNINSLQEYAHNSFAFARENFDPVRNSARIENIFSSA